VMGYVGIALAFLVILILILSLVAGSARYSGYGA
jgi:hypothetical protein